MRKPKMQDIKEQYNRLLNSKEFTGKGFFSGAFIMADKEEDLENTEWQLDFYEKEKDRITSYKMKEEIEVIENSEIFKQENSQIEELNLNEVKVKLSDALKTAKEILEKDKEHWIKIIVILQKV